MAGKQDKLSRSYRNAYEDALEHLLRSPHGKIFLWELLSRTGFMNSSFDPSSTAITNFQEGKRAVGLQLFQEMLAVNPNALGVIRKEATQYELDAVDDDEDE